MISASNNKLNESEAIIENLSKDLKAFFVEYSSLGFSSPNIKRFTTLVRKLSVDVPRMVSVCTEVCIRTWYYIFNRRNKEWTNPDLLNYK